jgi:hypothetical protein
MMEAVTTSETFVNVYKTTWYNIPETVIFKSQSISITKTNLLMLFKKMAAVCSKNHMKFENKLTKMQGY